MKCGRCGLSFDTSSCSGVGFSGKCKLCCSLESVGVEKDGPSGLEVMKMKRDILCLVCFVSFVLGVYFLK